MAETGYVVLTHMVYKENKHWVAICKELGTATFGHSLIEADKRLAEAVVCHLNTLEDVGECERFFKEHKIRFHTVIPTNDISVRIPIRENVFVHSHVQAIPAGASC